MAEKLWFLTDGIKVIGVYLRKREAEQEYQSYSEDPEFSYYDIYPIDINDLEDYPDECDLAMDEGFI